jgi:hypothetical protein
MQISKAMVVGWISFILGLLAVPQFLAWVPESYLPWVAVVAGALGVLMRWLNGALGVNPLSVAGFATVAAGILSIPEFLAVIPLTWMPTITMIAAVLTLVSRYVAGQQTDDPATAISYGVMKAPGGVS